LQIFYAIKKACEFFVKPIDKTGFMVLKYIKSILQQTVEAEKNQATFLLSERITV